MTSKETSPPVPVLAVKLLSIYSIFNVRIMVAPPKNKLPLGKHLETLRMMFAFSITWDESLPLMKRLFLRKLQTTPSGPLLPLYGRPSQLFTHGEGCYLVDSTGKRFIDFTSGIAVNALGHNHPKVVEIISKQAGKLIHLSNLYHNEYAQGLAQMIVDSLEKDPKMDKGQVFFSNSGTEANEGMHFRTYLSSMRFKPSLICTFFGM